MGLKCMPADCQITSDMCDSHALILLYQNGLYRAADTVNLLTPDDERNSHSKHVELQKDCRMNTYKKCILLVCL